MTEIDCGTEHGLLMSPHIEGGDVVEPLGERVLGRVIARDVFKRRAATRSSCRAGTLIDEKWVDFLEVMSVDEVVVRSPITCEPVMASAPYCYGRDLARGHRVNIGEAVGVIAAQSIGEPGTQLTMRTFHIGGGGQPDLRGRQRPGEERRHHPPAQPEAWFVPTARWSRFPVPANWRLPTTSVASASAKLPYGAVISVKEGERSTGRYRRQVGPHPPDRHRGGRYRGLRGHGRGHHRQASDRRTDRLWTNIEVMDPKGPSGCRQDIRPAVKLIDAAAKDLLLPVPTYRRVLPAGQRPGQPDRRRQGEHR